MLRTFVMIAAVTLLFSFPTTRTNAADHQLSTIPSSTESTELVAHGEFETGSEHWLVADAEATRLKLRSPGYASPMGAELKAQSSAPMTLMNAEPVASDLAAGQRLRVSAFLRANQPGMLGRLRVLEVSPMGVVEHGVDIAMANTDWQHVTFDFTVSRPDAVADLRLVIRNAVEGQKLNVDGISMKTLPRPPAQDPVTCAVNHRGIPSCGAYVGATYGSNSDPAKWEDELGRGLGVRRTFWGGSDHHIDKSVAVAREDLAAGRLPWMSYKLPYSWRQMADGAGDVWARKLIARLSELEGPVWIAFHHEPEGDGPIGDWTAMQERLGPMLRQGAPNAAFTVILTGWNQLYGPSEFALDAIWPDTVVDVAGFDPYNEYGVVKNGRRNTHNVDMGQEYFAPIAAWAQARGIDWAIAEIGFTDEAAETFDGWLQQTYNDLLGHGGIALSYFNTELNSIGSWQITTPVKANAFREILTLSVRVADLPLSD